MRKKPLIISTPFSFGLILFFILVSFPSFQFYDFLKEPYNTFISQITLLYREQNIPAIHYNNFEVRSNNDLLFEKIIKGKTENESFYVYIHTSKEPDITLPEKIKHDNGGLIIYRNKAILYNTQKNQETTFFYTQSKYNGSFTLDDKLIEKLSSKFGKIIFYGVVSFIFMCFFIGKFLCFIIIAMLYANKAKILNEGGNYSFALWTLVPPTAFQIIFPVFSKAGCCICGAYYIILIISVLIMGHIWQKYIETLLKARES